jgi:amino acid adenylation domain-containing protein
MQDTAEVAGQSSAAYWRAVLQAGGSTAIPRWTLRPTPGLATYEAPVPAGLLPRLQQLSARLGIGFPSVLLAAHAKVLSALCGEPEVATGYVVEPGREPLPCRLSTESGSWRHLLLQADRVRLDTELHKDFPVASLQGELSLGEPSFETVLDSAGGGGDLDEHTVVRLDVADVGEQLVLRLRYRAEIIDADCAARIVGYHLTALALVADDPEADHRSQSLLSAEEFAFQLDGLAGPARELPERRVHELIEDRVRAHPDTVAAVQGDREWTYGELNARANQIARALLAHGLAPEGVVAVVTERNLEWMAAVLAVFKAGGVYLPIEPHFPADRIRATLARADCRLVLTEPGSTTTLDQALEALDGVETCMLAAALVEGHADDDLNVRVAADQLAYIYFTSGSTGEPKGAMCEHAGMLNHLYAKIDDLSIAEGQVVAQTAPQCFDISLWQLISALLVGGRTLIVEQEVILDVQRFVDKIIEGRVAVLQVVPSYLEVVLSYLDLHTRELPDLRFVSVTGEALKKELTQRWFQAMPGIKLVNAYGLTETSDDTNHEVLDRPPFRDRVPLGRPVNNVHLYVVDEHLSPVPLGAPGAIVFSGICVGRGYVNDPDRTRLAYLDDPHRKGQRLYYGGDFGRWLPEGKLEFLGRRDTQVKISGFRIEIGEIENALLSIPGVRDGAVVVAERADQSKHLVAFYAGGQPLDVDLLQDQLGRSLPEYMVPAIFHWREALPLTANSKIDRKQLTALAAELAVVDGDDQVAPNSPSEKRLADAWSTVLGISPDQIGRLDHFFDRGGTSLSAVKLALALDRAVSLKDITRNPVLADLAEVFDGRQERRSGVLQLLSQSDRAQSDQAQSDQVQDRALVCFPYAGGNAVNFRPMASALRGRGVAVFAVELPGHDLAADREAFAPLPGVVDQVVDEIVRRDLSKIMLWGHSSGAAAAIEVARRLEARGVEVVRVFLGAQLLGDAADRRSAISELTQRRDAELAARLSSDNGFTELGELDAQRAEHVGAAYRHDCVSAHRYFAEALEQRPARKLSAPVTVVLAADDPATADGQGRYADWELLADHVDLQELPDGGHYFLRTRPTEAARAVLRAADLLVTA